jgi:hypothetical protein
VLHHSEQLPEVGTTPPETTLAPRPPAEPGRLPHVALRVANVQISRLTPLAPASTCLQDTSGAPEEHPSKLYKKTEHSVKGHTAGPFKLNKFITSDPPRKAKPRRRLTHEPKLEYAHSADRVWHSVAPATPLGATLLLLLCYHQYFSDATLLSTGHRWLIGTLCMALAVSGRRVHIELTKELRCSHCFVPRRVLRHRRSNSHALH